MIQPLPSSCVVYGPLAQAAGVGPLVVGIGVVLAVAALTMLLLVFNYGQLWFQAYWSKAPVTFLELVGMSLRQVNARTIVQARIMATQAGIGREIPVRRLEAHSLAGGDVPRVTRAIIAAQRAGLDLDFDKACAIDLAGRDVLDAVQTSVNPKVIDCPDPTSGKTTLSAVARNGVELRIRARVTVRTNLQQLIGGATEETIIARVGEGIITSIGSSESHFVVMEHPDQISKAVLARGLDAQTAFQIVSIARQHYAEHLEKPFYPSLEEFITAAPVVATVMSGPEVVRVVREMLGATSGLKATPGTIRGDHSSSRQMNLVHASDSPESAEREIAIYFQPHEILEWDPTLACWLQAPGEA